ncbi:MAG: FAD-dependent oxidoreductase [Pirellulales bacterium]|nr:FAD-dependent oxidoreductase [Pirellulales bacterium]
MHANLEFLVFSHLRWNFVYQRPQHILSRLARHHKVYFMEEPLETESSTGMLEVSPSAEDPNVIVLRPHTNVREKGFTPAQIQAITPLLKGFLSENHCDNYAAWLYTPLAHGFLEQLRPQAVIYDCMDALDAFLHAPPELREQEEKLLTSADLVFTGGPSLFRRLQGRHPAVHCFASSVDAEHFSQAQQQRESSDHRPEPADQQFLRKPRLGYFGVIDERIDLELLDTLARSRPNWEIVMVGPVVKISPESLPRHPNLHYLGQKPYAELPLYMRSWDVCLLPFALNDSTRYISPTKTLEYMAAEKPIVSTPITDVAEPYGEVVYLADTPDTFVAQCSAAMNRTPSEKERQVEHMRGILAKTSWERTVELMRALIMDHLGQENQNGASVNQSMNRLKVVVEKTKGNSLGNGAGQSYSANGTNKQHKNNDHNIDAPVVVIGAGPTGLSAAYHLGSRGFLIEQNSTVGGWCRSQEVAGFTFDCAGHIMFSNDAYVQELYRILLEDNVHWQNREAWIYSKNVYTRYPFQGALYGLPPNVIKECLVGAIESRFGSLKSPVSPDSKANSAHSDTKNNGSTTKSGGNGRAVEQNGNGHAAHSDGASTQRHGTNGTLKNGAATNGISPLGLSGGTPAPVRGGRLGNMALPGQRPELHREILPAASTPPAPLSCQLSKDTTNGNSAKIPAGDVKDCCADGILESSAPLVDAAPHDAPAKEPRNFEEFIYKVWGAGIARHFAIPYNQKLWAVPLTEMETSWLGGRVPLPDLEEIIDGALQPVAKPMGPNSRFGYPLRGGFQALMNGFLPHVRDRLALNCRVAAVSPARHTITLQDGRVARYQKLISTMPLPVLVRMLGDEAPPEIHEAVSRLRHVSVRCVNLGVGHEKLTEKHWIYYPEQTVFHRIFVQGNASPYCNPPGGFGLTCEITYSPHKPLPCDGEELTQLCIRECREVGIIGPDDPIWVTSQVDMPYAYVVYDHQRAAAISVIRQFMAENDIILSGRYSEWEYYNSDHAFIAGKKAAEEALESIKPHPTHGTAKPSPETARSLA